VVVDWELNEMDDDHVMLMLMMMKQKQQLQQHLLYQQLELLVELVEKIEQLIQLLHIELNHYVVLFLRKMLNLLLDVQLDKKELRIYNVYGRKRKFYSRYHSYMLD
jgi:hypothetical protein